MPYSRPFSYPYPGEFKTVKDAEGYAKRLYAAILENDSRGEFLGDNARKNRIEIAEKLTVFSGTAPTGNVTDAFQQYSADIAAGNAAPHFRTENGKIVKLYQQVLTAGLEEAYEAGELDSEAEVITAINATNAKLNDLIEALHNTGLLASS